MIGYSLVGANDLAKAKTFYDALLGLLGASPAMDFPNGARVYAVASGRPMFGVTAPYDGKPASIGNGAMTAFLAESRKQVDQIHAKALELGGADEGGPGVRGDDPDGFYGAYFRDLDGNKLCVFRVGAP